MRAGTQTLIQALQALPLVDDPENDEELTSHDMSPAESDSDDEGKHGGLLLYFCTLCNQSVAPLSNGPGFLYPHDLPPCGPLSSRGAVEHYASS
jgi:hypothetical protein